MNTENMEHQLIHWIKYCKSNEVKNVVASKVVKCLISEFQYANLLQMEICDILCSKEWQIDFIAKYGQYMRECIGEDKDIDKILLLLCEKIWTINERTY